MVASRAPAAPAGTPEADPDQPTSGHRRPARLALDPATVGRLAWLVVVGGIALRAWAQLSLPLAQGDFTALADGAALGADPALLVTSLGSPDSPVALALGWLAAALSPAQAWGPGLLMVVGWTACTVLAWFALRDLLGRRPTVLIPLAVLVFAPLALPGTARWETAPEAITMVLALILAAWSAGNLHRNRPTAAAWRAGLAGLLALTASGNPLSTVTVVLGVLIVGPLLHPGGMGRAAALRRSWTTWSLPALATLIAWLATVAHGWPFFGPPQDWGSIASTAGTAIGQAVVPALIGGPLAWIVTGVGAAPVAAPGILLVLAAWEILILGVVVLALRNRGPLRIWAATLAGIVVLAIAPALAVERALPVAAGTMSWLAPATVLAAAAIAASLRGSAAPDPMPSGSGAGRRAATIAVVVLVDLGIVASALSTSTWRTAWADQSDAEWLRSATRSLAAADPSIPLIDQAVPESVMSPALAPRNTIATVFAPLPDRPPIGAATSELLLFDASGSLVPGIVEGLSVPDGPTTCTWRATGPVLTIPLGTYVPGPSAIVALEYESASAAAADVSLVLAAADSTAESSAESSAESTAVSPAESTVTTFGTGSATAFVSVPGAGNAVRIGRLPADASLCITRVTIGRAIIADDAAGQS